MNAPLAPPALEEVRAHEAEMVAIRRGEGSEGGCKVHNPGDDFNDAALSTGASYWLKLAEAWLKKAA